MESSIFCIIDILFFYFFRFLNLFYIISDNLPIFIIFINYIWNKLIDHFKVQDIAIFNKENKI